MQNFMVGALIISALVAVCFFIYWTAKKLSKDDT